MMTSEPATISEPPIATCQLNYSLANSHPSTMTQAMLSLSIGATFEIGPICSSW